MSGIELDTDWKPKGKQEECDLYKALLARTHALGVSRNKCAAIVDHLRIEDPESFQYPDIGDYRFQLEVYKRSKACQPHDDKRYIPLARHWFDELKDDEDVESAVDRGNLADLGRAPRAMANEPSFGLDGPEGNAALVIKALCVLHAEQEPEPPPQEMICIVYTVCLEYHTRDNPEKEHINLGEFTNRYFAWEADVQNQHQATDRFNKLAYDYKVAYEDDPTFSDRVFRVYLDEKDLAAKRKAHREQIEKNRAQGEAKRLKQAAKKDKKKSGKS